jgi:hypothetical protein
LTAGIDTFERLFPADQPLLSEAQRARLTEAAQSARIQGTLSGRVLRLFWTDLVCASCKLEGVEITWLDAKSIIRRRSPAAALGELALKVVQNHANILSLLVCQRIDL